MKFVEQMKAALERKHAAQHPDARSNDSKGVTKPEKVRSNKPQKKVTGRGR